MYIGDLWPYILEIAAARLTAHYHRGNTIRLRDYIEVVGAAGEVAARRFLGLPTDLPVAADGGYDLELDQLKIDVKSTLWKEPPTSLVLQWRANKELKADLLFFVLVHPAVRQGVPVGFATAAEILAAPVNYRRSEPCHEISIHKLHHPWRLFRLLDWPVEPLTADCLLDPVALGLEATAPQRPEVGEQGPQV